jgi:hypothetical protein
MASSRQLAAGRHLSSVVATLLTVDAVGTLTLGTAYTLAQRSTLTGWIEDMNFETSYEVEDGTVLGSIAANDIPHVFRHEVQINEPLRYVSTGNLCAALMYNTVANGDGTTGTPYVKFSIARAGKTFALYVLMKSYREEYRKNRLTGMLSCSAMDPQFAQTIYV